MEGGFSHSISCCNSQRCTLKIIAALFSVEPLWSGKHLLSYALPRCSRVQVQRFILLQLVRDSLLDEDFVSAAGAVEALSASGGSLSREGFNLRKRFLPTIAAVELEGMTMGLELLFRLAHEVIRPVNLGRGWMVKKYRVALSLFAPALPCV
eukprot:5321982-Pyramimonas_sp.AAC.1